MAKRLTSLAAALGDDDDQVTDDAPAAPPATSEPATEAGAKPGASSTPAKAPERPRSAGRTAGAPRTRKTAQRAPRATKSGTRTSPATPDASSAEAGDPIRVRAVDVTDAKRVSLYLDPEDWRALSMAKLEDGADLNSRIRAMIAVWRGDTRVAKKVDRLAQTAPRGGQH